MELTEGSTTVEASLRQSEEVLKALSPVPETPYKNTSTLMEPAII